MDGVRSSTCSWPPPTWRPEVTAGVVFHDPTGALARLRKELRWYPDDIWRWVLPAQWRRIAQEEAFVGRAVEVGDDLGSRIILARLARELMRVWFLLHRTYWPYSKWFGTCFQGLPGSAPLARALTAAVGSAEPADREAGLLLAYRLAAEAHNRLDPERAVDPEPRLYFSRPWKVLMADRLADACLDGIADPWLRRLPLIGTGDQAVDSTDILTDAARIRRLHGLYDEKN